jgi:hypothetical protein
MAIRDLVRGEALAEPRITFGRALRFWEELYLDDQPETVSNNGSGTAKCLAPAI